MIRTIYFGAFSNLAGLHEAVKGAMRAVVDDKVPGQGVDECLPQQGCTFTVEVLDETLTDGSHAHNFVIRKAR